VVSKEDYLEWVRVHLDEAATEVSAEKLQSIFDEAFELLDDVGDFLSDDERGFIEETLKTRAIPTPKLLIKDHKAMDERGNYPTRLIVPASNFTAAFPKAGYLGIRTIFDKNRIEYQKSTIIHASQLKSKLERMQLQKGEVTIASFDAVEMYPSIKFRLVEKAVEFFARDLDSDQKERIEACLEMVRFGMGNTLITFVDKYYEYGGEADVEEKGLTIGGFESAWLADLVASYLLENAVEVFKPAAFKGIYRDDGFVVFKKKLSKAKLAMWLRKFQKRVDELAESKFLKFTAVIWGNDKEDSKEYDNVTVNRGDSFPYLDMEMYWSEDGDLRFRVHLKPNQQLKYLNKGSTHTEACFAAIPNGVLKRLALLTTRTEISEVTRMDILYPLHAKALRAANLAPPIFPTHGEILDTIDERRKSRQVEEGTANNKSRDRRTVRFCIGMSKHWGNPVHARIKELRNKHGLNWLRVTMSYHRFTNLRGIFQGDLNKKLMEGIISRDFQDLACNCNKVTKIDGECIYGGDCRKSCVVYKVTCKIPRCCKQFYIGNTQQKMKNRQGQHLQDVKRLVRTGEASDSFARHFAKHVMEGEVKPTNGDLRKIMKYEILWQANPISAMKTFGKLNCALCMRERVEILRAHQQDELSLINCNLEIFGACRHKTKFHRFLKEAGPVKSTSTDDGVSQKRVPGGRKNEASIFQPRQARTCHLEGKVTVCVPVRTVLV
jgi:hypothetical protein